MTLFVILTLIILTALFFAYLTTRLRNWHTWQGPDVEPCETCLRWGECHGADIEFCPLCIDWRRL